jgi:holo-[acyl-carrier protein] synthase
MSVLGLGTEIVECLRVAKLIEQHGEQFLLKAFTKREIDFCRSRAHSTQHFAAYWAAKQAVLKAFGLRWRKGIAWSDLEIRRGTNIRHTIAMRGGVRELLQDRQGGDILITMSHCRTHATATVIVLARKS